ncbi:MAG: conditioned medium-induced protein 4 [Halobacteriales archaeon]
MDEKTEQLRDIFLDLAEGETVTERQSASRGSLAERSDDDAELADVIAAMRERYTFVTDLDDAALATVARGFYDGQADAAIARELGDVSAGTVRRARLDLHLVTDRDLDAPFDLDDLRRLRADDASAGEAAETLGVSESTVRRYAHALDAQARRRLANDRYREAFDRLLADRDLAEPLTASVRETGLREAAEDIETNVSF